MKCNQNTKNHHRLLITLTLLISSCSKAEDHASSEYQGKFTAKAMNAKVHHAYLHCYPLEVLAKNICLNELALKYISKREKSDIDYVQAFQFESEKLGFKRF